MGSDSDTFVEPMVQQAPIRVSYEGANGTRESATASELSLGGVFVETKLKSPKVGSLVALEIESGSTKVAIDGRVLAHKPNGFSVGFIDLPNDVASSLHFILSTKMPRKGTQLGLGEAEEGVAKYVSEPRLPVAAVPSSGANAAEPAPLSSKPGATAPAVPATDAYAPRHPTPRIMPAAPISQPAGRGGPPYGAPPAPTSSAPAVMVPNAPSSRPMMPPPSSTYPAPKSGSKTGVIALVLVVVILAAVATAVVLLR
jgi:hypothetical protein